MPISPNIVDRYRAVSRLAQAGIAGERVMAEKIQRAMEKKYPGIAGLAALPAGEDVPVGAHSRTGSGFRPSGDSTPTGGSPSPGSTWFHDFISGLWHGVTTDAAIREAAAGASAVRVKVDHRRRKVRVALTINGDVLDDVVQEHGPDALSTFADAAGSLVADGLKALFSAVGDVDADAESG